jgi:lipopolysaccharide transport system permease protein
MNSYNNKTLFIDAKRKVYKLNIIELIQYRDLLRLFVKRDFIAVYKQTILGPLWFVISPLLAATTQYLVFGYLAGLPSDGVHYFLFILGGNVLWSYFSSSLIATSNTFKDNEGIFGKVYFPRILVPLTITISNLVQFSIKLVLFLIMVFIFGASVKINFWALLLPLLLMVMALISMGIGMLISSLTAKYKDFAHLMSFFVGLLMFITPILYPTSMFIDRMNVGRKWLIYLNPLTSIFDVFRFGFLGSGEINFYGFLWSIIFGVGVFLFGGLVFSKVEKTFMDVI